MRLVYDWEFSLSAGLFLLFLFSFFFFWLGFLLYYAMLVLKRGQIFFMVYRYTNLFSSASCFSSCFHWTLSTGFRFSFAWDSFFVLAVCAASCMEV